MEKKSQWGVKKGKAEDTQGTKAIIDFNSFAMRLATFKGFPSFPTRHWMELMYCDLSNRKGNNLRLFIELPSRHKTVGKSEDEDTWVDNIRWQTLNLLIFIIFQLS